MASDKATSANDEISSVLAPLKGGADLVDVIQTMISGLVQVVAVQRPNLDGLLAAKTRGVLRPTIRVEIETKWETAIVSGCLIKNRPGSLPLHITILLSDARTGHILPDEIKTALEEVLILLAPPLAHVLVV